VQSRRIKQSRRENTISSSRAVPLVETWGNQLSKMEEVLIMGLAVRQFSYSSINKCFQAEK